MAVKKFHLVGACGGFSSINDVRNAGFDYCEIPAKDLTAEGVGELKRDKVFIYSSNLLLPGQLKLAANETFEFAVSRVQLLAELSGKIAVFGSGGSRAAQPEESHDDAEARFVDFAVRLNEVAAGYGVAVAPESLRREETNVGNRLGELATKLADGGCGFTLDTYHLYCDWKWNLSEKTGVNPDRFETWLKTEIPTCPVHVHWSGERRTLPEAGDHAWMQLVVARLDELGYTGALTFEGEWAGPWRTLREEMNKNLYSQGLFSQSL